MPFHLPHLGHRHHHDNDDKKKHSKKASVEHEAVDVEDPDAPTGFVPVSHSRRTSMSPTSPVLSPTETNANGSSSILGLRGTASPPANTSEPHRPAFANHRSTSTSSGSQLHSQSSGQAQTPGQTQIQSILKNPTSPSSVSGSEYTFSSGSGSAFANIHKRMSSLAFDRTETIESMSSSMDDNRRGSGDYPRSSSSPSTPGTSVSSFNAHCPLPTNSFGSSIDAKFPFFMMTLSSVSTLSFIALPVSMRTIVFEAINKAWRRGVSKMTEVDYQPELMKRHKDKGCDGGVWEVTMKGEAWMPTSSEQVSSKRILINLMTEFAREGYRLTSSFRTSAKDTGKDALIFIRDDSTAIPDPDPIFFAVAFYSHDRIWIIDAEADVGEALEEGIKSWWVDGIRDARVRERHCREIRLRGAPWTSHSTTSLISARCIHLTILKLITHCSTGYDFVGSVDMADREEGEMPVTFYRKRWTGASAGLQ
ncbi:hypothetical protein I316_04954 [Kwoniella heveanensis BCC8398]|uniref:Uncharacterized protein n=1 Tax=Kwoniella heveanensis BCC8398 TaxID=1296120 RepID=A0A1B9GQC9_9TREE|nr:hypothetical protein I316_04954 [Kwoniella heveanensis BCC8398]